MTQNLLVAQRGKELPLFPKMTNRRSTYASHIEILPKEVKLKPIYECLSATILTNFNELNQDFKPPH